jgi:CxxC motif-containing protein (DUF1111 family)
MWILAIVLEDAAEHLTAEAKRSAAATEVSTNRLIRCGITLANSLFREPLFRAGSTVYMDVLGPLYNGLILKREYVMEGASLSVQCRRDHSGSKQHFDRSNSLEGRGIDR